MLHKNNFVAIAIVAFAFFFANISCAMAQVNNPSPNTDANQSSDNTKNIREALEAALGCSSTRCIFDTLSTTSEGNAAAVAGGSLATLAGVSEAQSR